jgi:predicted SnoaL-like aldol condensation-catalyzing enzyme
MATITKTSHKIAAESFLKLAASGDVRRAFATLAGPGFRHHNVHFAGTADALATAMEENARRHPHKTLAIRQMAEEGDRVWTLSEVHHEPGDRGAAVMHIFRFDGDRIVELWDLGQELPEGSPNTNGAF